jgi:hypothetical protein
MPLEQLANSLTFYAFFTSSKQGVTGLTVTADVYRNGTAILTAQACTAVGGGLYSYTLSSASVNAEGEYIALFKTASTGVDQQHIPAIWCISKAGVEYLDAQVTSRAAIADYTSARATKLDNLDAAVTSRLASGNVTVGSYAVGQDPATLVWAAGTRTLTGFGFSVTVGTNNDKTGYALAVTPPTVANIWDAATSGMATVGSVGKRIADYVDAAVSSRLATSGYTTPDNTSIGTILSRADVAISTRASGADYTTARAVKLDNLDATISSRLTPAGITSMQADVTAIKTPVTTNLDTTISSRLAPAGITSMQADVTAIKTPVVANVDATISSRLAGSAYTPTTAMSADVATILSRTDVATSTRASGADYTTARAAKIDNLDATISSRLAPDGITSMQADVTAIKTPVATNLDATISSRLAPAGITSLQADVTAIKTPVVANLDATISSRLASSTYTPTTAMSADVATILSRTDVATSTRADGSAYTTTRAAKLDRLDVAVSSRVSAGTGAIAYTTTVTAPATGAPIEGVAAWVTSDSAGTNVIAGTQYTSASGTCTFMLDAGSYYMWLQKTGWNFSNPVSITVST